MYKEKKENKKKKKKRKKKTRLHFLSHYRQVIKSFLNENKGRYKTWTLDSVLDYGLNYGLNFGLDFGLGWIVSCCLKKTSNAVLPNG